MKSGSVKMILAVLAAALILPSLALAGSNPPPPTGFKIKPNLQAVTQTSVGVMWETYNLATATVKISVNSNMTGAVTQSIAASGKRQRITLGGLAPNTVYYYQVVSDGETSPKGSFVTALPKGSRLPFRFGVYGDSRQATWYEDIVAKYGDNDDHLPVCISMNSYAPDFLIHVGDLVQDGNNTDQIYNFFSVEKELLASNPLIATYGNHEFSGGADTGNTKMDEFLIPLSGPNFAYYSIVYGNIKLIVLNTGAGVWNTDNYDVIKTGSTQWNWLKGEITAGANDPDIDHIFLSMHVPPYSCANFGDNPTLITAITQVVEITSKVKAVFMGHEHDYQRLQHDGVDYILSGGAGSPVLDLPWKGGADDTSAVFIKYDDCLNYVLVDVAGSTVHCEARKVQGNGNSSSSILESYNL